mmetsp:Transcript_21539/g.47150  ORF Transcript_21539/g.47150 Transcript_21539/m.47150 type:complete len:152 (+) Transcript_21539:70-525(+)
MQLPCCCMDNCVAGVEIQQLPVGQHMQWGITKSPNTSLNHVLHNNTRKIHAAHPCTHAPMRLRVPTTSPHMPPHAIICSSQRTARLPCGNMRNNFPHNQPAMKGPPSHLSTPLKKSNRGQHSCGLATIFTHSSHTVHTHTLNVSIAAHKAS